MKVGLLSLPPTSYNALRIIFAVVSCLLILAASKTHKRVEPKHYGVFLVCILSFFIYQLLFAYGINNTTSGNASLTMLLLPVCVIAINHYRKTETITPQVILGALISMTGLLLIIFTTGKKVDFSQGNLYGILLLILSQFTFAVFTVYSKDAVQHYSNYQLVTYTITISGLLFVIIALPELHSVHYQNLPSAAWWSIAFSGILAMTAANFIWAWGAKQIGCTRLALYNNLPPVFAVISGYYILNETFNIWQLFATGLILLGLYVTRRRPRSKEG
jgi:drug/metabolite transporter (DMT)-like permease